MKPYATTFAALALLALAGCGNTAATTSAAAPTVGSSVASSATAPASASSSSASAAPVLGANTPDGVATNFLRALARKDSATVCNSIAVAGKPMNSNQTTMDRCASSVMPQVLQMMPAELATMADQLSVTGATITGTTASYANATFAPSQARAVMVKLEAVQVNGQWYVAVGSTG